MRVVLISELVYSEPRPTTAEERKAKHDAILDELRTPVHLGVLGGLHYDHKSNRYAASFAPGEEKKLTLKVLETVADFLAQHATGRGYWLGLMQDGTLVDVNLIQS